MLIAIITITGLQWFAPPGWWMTVKKVYVHDAVVGQSPAINIDVQWFAYFFMRWHTDVKRAGANEEFTDFCSADNSTLVYAGLKIPTGLNLDLWLRSDKCKLPIGTYYMETTWEWNYWLLIKSFSVDSNVFHVLPIGAVPVP